MANEMTEFDNKQRREIITACWTLMQRASDLTVPGVLDAIVRSTNVMTTIQLAAACTEVASKPLRPGTTILHAIMSHVDRGTRDAQRAANVDNDPLIIPAMAIDRTRRRTQDAILMKYARRSSRGSWSADEIAACRDELEADSPSLAARRRKAEADLAFFASHRRFPVRVDAVKPRAPGDEHDADV